MKTNLTFKSIKYVVNYEKKIVACIIEAKINSFNIPYGENFKVVALSRCSPMDTFNEETGRRIAESRAKIKAYSRAMGYQKDLCNYLRQSYNAYLKMDEGVRFCGVLVKREKEHLEQLIN